MGISIKICGLTSETAVNAIIASKVDYAGFIYFPSSPRHVELPRANELKSLLPSSIKSVSVLVDPSDALLNQVQSILQPDYIQLHGKETPQRLTDIKKQFSTLKIIKAISVRNSGDVAKAMQFYNCADMLLFDAKPPESLSSLPGGNGISFDWELLINREFQLPWFLSGGLNADNVADAIQRTGAKMIDVSSGVESSPGVKDIGSIDMFVKKALSKSS